jgi:hypothetical protein
MAIFDGFRARLEPCQSHQSLAPKLNGFGLDWGQIRNLFSFIAHRIEPVLSPFFLAPILITSLVATTGRQPALSRVENPHKSGDRV